MNNICPNCKNFINLKDKKCRVCGFILSQDIVQKKNYVLCPGCKNYEYRNMPKCRRCGYVFIPQQQIQYQYPLGYEQPRQYQQIYMDPFIFGIIISVIGFVSCIISVFLPYVKISAFGYEESINLFDNSFDAYIILLICVIGSIVCLCKCKTFTVDALISGIVLLAFSIYHINNATEKIDGLGEYSGFTKVGSGLYLFVIGSIVVTIGGIALCITNNNKKKSRY